MTLYRVCIIGSGSWGSAIAKIVGENTWSHPEFFDEVNMYVYEEIVENQNLSDIINTKHENVKYLPGRLLPENVKAIPDIVQAAKDADILVFVVPHNVVKTICQNLVGKIKHKAHAISLIRGFEEADDGGIQLVSRIISNMLNIPCSVLMGAYLAAEIADGKFCETTVGCADVNYKIVFQRLFQTENLRVTATDDVETVEICSALKNIIGCAAGFMDGLNCGDNTKAAVIRMGLQEMIKFVGIFYPGYKLSTFFESCGISELIANCYGGSNRKMCEEFVKSGKSIKVLEDEMFRGNIMPGPYAAAQVNYMIRRKSLETEFPLFTTIHKICTQILTPSSLIGNMKLKGIS